MATASNLVVIDRASEGSGAVVFWTLTGETSHARLSDAWEAYCLPPKLAPPAPSPARALRRAVEATAGSGRRVLVRPLPQAGAFAIVREQVTGGGAGAVLAHDELMRVWVEGDDLRFARGACSYEAYDQARERIEAAFGHAADTLDAGAMGTWLVRLATQYAAGTALRERGGVYYVPPTTTWAWEEVVECVQSAGVGGSIYTIPAMHSDDAIRAVTDSLLAEIRAALQTVSEEVQSGELSARMLRTRQRRCDDMLAKLGAYDGMLGQALGGVRTEIASAQAAAVEAEIIAADREAQEAA